jgi:nitrite reductase/ring-hydroxylating ferredoxin subunit
MSSPWRSIGITVHDLASKQGRHHFIVDGRYLTVLQHRGHLYCIDSPCHHASGPLGEGAVSDIEGIPCIKCPWHNFIFALDTGERVQQELIVQNDLPTGTFTPASQMQYPLQSWPPEALGPAKRTGQKAQRVHEARMVGDAGSIEICLSEDRDRFLSDGPAVDQKRGKMCISIAEGVPNKRAKGASSGDGTDADLSSVMPLSSAAAILMSALPRSQLNKSSARSVAAPESEDDDGPTDPNDRTIPPGN